MNKILKCYEVMVAACIENDMAVQTTQGKHGGSS
jgi:hypothetical protein